VTTYWLTNDAFRVEISPFGATLHRFEVRCDEGWRNIVLSRPNPAAPVDGFLGATVGRYANRIADARFELDGVTYQLARNEPPNMLHGGGGGAHGQAWDVESSSGTALALRLVSPDGDQGFPGRLEMTAAFALLDNGLQVAYGAHTDAPTVVNMTTHPYFIMSGDGVGTVDEHVLCVPAGRYTPTDDAGIPTGEILPVDGTGLDFRTPRPIGPARAQVVAAHLERTGGFDHNLVVDGEGMRDHVRLRGPDGLTLVVRSDAPAVQLYDGAHLDGTLTSAQGRPYVQRGALAIEPQNYPDAPNHANFPSSVLRPGERYRTITQWLVEQG